MAIITLEDLDGQIDGTMFAETFAEVSLRYPSAVSNEQIVFVRGKVDKKRETPSLLVNEVIPVADAVARLTTDVCLRLRTGAKHSPEVIAALPPLLAKHRGATPIYFQVTTATGRAMLRIDKQHSVRPSADLVGDLEQMLGHGSVDLAGAGNKRRTTSRAAAAVPSGERRRRGTSRRRWSRMISLRRTLPTSICKKSRFKSATEMFRSVTSRLGRS